MRAYSQDLRERVVQTVSEGVSQAETARRFKIGLRSVSRWVSTLKHSGSLVPKPRPGRLRAIPREQETGLIAQLEAHPDATLEEHCELWQAKTNRLVSRSSMDRAITRVGWSLKKNSTGQRTR